MTLTAKIVIFAAILAVGAWIGVTVVKEREVPEHIVRELRREFPKEEDARFQIDLFREQMPEFNASVRKVQQSIDRLGVVQATIFQLNFDRKLVSNQRRLEEWVILDQKFLSNEVAVATLQFARAPTTYGAMSMDCFLPGLGIEWKDDSGRSVRQVICLNCKNVRTYIDNEMIELPLTHPGLHDWEIIYKKHFEVPKN